MDNQPADNHDTPASDSPPNELATNKPQDSDKQTSNPRLIAGIMGGVFVSVACIAMVLCGKTVNPQLRVLMLQKESEAVSMMSGKAPEETEQARTKVLDLQLEMADTLAGIAMSAKDPEAKSAREALQHYKVAMTCCDTIDDARKVFEMACKLASAPVGDPAKLKTEIGMLWGEAALELVQQKRIRQALSFYDQLKELSAPGDRSALLDKLIPAARAGGTTSKVVELINDKCNYLRKARPASEELIIWLIDAAESDKTNRAARVKEILEIIRSYPKEKTFAQCSIIIRVVTTLPGLSTTDAAPLLADVQNQLQKAGKQNTKEYARTFFLQGRIHSRLNQFDQATASYFRASYLFRDSNFAQESVFTSNEGVQALARCANSAANVSRMKSSLTDELTYLTTAEPFAAHDWYFFDFANRLVALYCREGNLDESVRIARSRCEYLEKKSLYQFAAEIWIQVAELALFKKDVALAKEFATNTLEELKKIPTGSTGCCEPPLPPGTKTSKENWSDTVLVERAWIRQRIAAVLIACGNIDVEPLLKEAIHDYERLGRAKEASVAINQLVVLLERRGDTKSILELQRSYLERFRNIEMILTYCDRLRHSGRAAEMEPYLRSGLQMLQAEPATASGALWYLQLGSMIQTSSMPDKQVESQNCFKRSLQLANKFGQVAVAKAVRNKITK